MLWNPLWFRMSLLPCTEGGSGVGGWLSLKVMYRQQFAASFAWHWPVIGSGSTVGAAWAMPEGTTTPMVPRSAAETAASPNLRTIANPLLLRAGGRLRAGHPSAMGRSPSFRPLSVVPAATSSPYVNGEGVRGPRPPPV